MYFLLCDGGLDYPVAGHFPGDPVRAMDVFRGWLECMDQYLK